MRDHRRSRVALLALGVTLLCLLGQVAAVLPASAALSVRGSGESVAAVPGAFVKAAPSNGATGVGVAVNLSWWTASEATSYEYCYDTVNNGACDDGWNSTGTNTFVVESGLAYNTTHYWQVRANNGSGSTYADGGTWWSFTTVAAAAPNDDFGAATAIGAVPYGTTQGVAGATTVADDPAFTCVGGQKYRTVWFRYTAPSAQPLIIDTMGSNYDTVLAVWTGSRGSLTSVACNDDFGDGLQSKVEVVPTAGTTYYIEVASYSAAPTNSQLALNAALTGAAPGAFAKTAPANGVTGLGVEVELSWQSAARVISYQYCFDTVDNGVCDGVWINAGSGTDDLHNGLALNTLYYWQVRASNSLGTSYADGGTWWSLSTVAAAPPNDDFGAATPIGAVPYNTTQSVAGATTATDDPMMPCAWGQMSRTVWFRYTAPSAQSLGVDTFGSDYYPVLAVWTGSRGSLTSVACEVSSSSVEFATTAGTTYYIEIASYHAGPATSQLILNVGTPPGAFGKTLPANGATGFGVAATLSWGTALGATSYEYCYDTVNNDACDGSWTGTGTGTSVLLSGLAPGTTHWWQVRARNGFGTTLPDGGTWWSFATAAPALLEASFRSVGPYDGWVLEQDELSGKGGTLDAGAATARLGDDASDRQYRSILHFDTATLPDTAVITGVTVKIKKQSITGTNPFDTHGFLIVDMKAGPYHDNPTLEKLDFHAVGSRGNVGRFIKTPALGWYRAPLRGSSYDLVNLTGTTQFRLRFATDDNDDLGADYLSFYTGNTPTAGDRPELIITYYLP